MRSGMPPDEVRAALVREVPDESARLAFYQWIGQQALLSTANLAEDAAADSYGPEIARDVAKIIREGSAPWPPFLPDGW